MKHLQDKQSTPVFIESAGGVHSPTPSGRSQLELYRPLRTPVILVADSNLGGISTTISAYESLRLHGYDISVIIGFRAKWGNLPYIASKIPAVPTLQIPPPPARYADPDEDAESMSVYYDLVAGSGAIQALKQELVDAHQARLRRLSEMPDKALSKFWYPFTQHAHLEKSKIDTIDSAFNDDFATFDPSMNSLKPVFDGSASWWTQGLGHSNSELALEAAYAASRYGHVILPNAVNEPALALAERMLETVGNGWASRVYYSDNGATAIEVALKMALKAARVRYGQDKDNLKLGIAGFTGSYHGDTIGAMDASDPNIYNEEVDWYQTRGVFFDPPHLAMKDGKWRLSIPEQAGDSPSTDELDSFSSLKEIFDLKSRINSKIARVYRDWINSRLESAVNSGQKLGALLFEPILLGAGGMIFVDPLFQHLLTCLVRSSTMLCPPAADSKDSWTGLPVITDEVFTGLYRLSHARASSLLDLTPDISVNAKLLTGGVVPLSTTMASEAIFKVFFKDEKKDALLHGHSYTAHPVGTSVALASISKLQSLFELTSSETSMLPSTIESARTDWGDEPIFSIWSRDFVTSLSHHPRLSHVICLGSVLAINLVANDAGYSSMVATKVLDKLRAGTIEDGGVMARPLGSVVYFMASQVTTKETAERVQRLILSSLSDE